MLIEIESQDRTTRVELMKALEQEAFVKEVIWKERQAMIESYVTDYSIAILPWSKDSWVHVVEAGHGAEWVRANLSDFKPPYTAASFWKLDKALGNEGTFIVYLMQDEDTEELTELWNKFLLDTRCKVLRVDPRFSMDEVVKSIKRYILEVS